MSPVIVHNFQLLFITCRLPRSAYENCKLFKILRVRTVVTCYGRGVSRTDLVSHLQTMIQITKLCSEFLRVLAVFPSTTT